VGRSLRSSTNASAPVAFAVPASVGTKVHRWQNERSWRRPPNRLGVAERRFKPLLRSQLEPRRRATTAIPRTAPPIPRDPEASQPSMLSIGPRRISTGRMRFPGV